MEMSRIEQLMQNLSRLDKRLSNLYKRNRIINYQIQQVQQKRMAVVKQIEDEQFLNDKSP